jgi:biotin transport system substrate-specific component
MEAIKKIELNKIAKVILIAVLGTLLLTISAKIKIPFYPVPMTMQTFVVLFLGITLGPKIGLLTISLYLFEGIFGLPVFAGTPEKGIGFIYFTGPTMGYLIGFLVATYLAGYFKYENCFDFHKFKLNKDLPFFLALVYTISSVVTISFKNLIKLIFAVSFIYIFGLLWLGFLIGWDKPIFQLGAQPFLLAELFKMLILAIIAGSLNKVKKFI